MPQTCPSCLWISTDDAQECERCGEPFNRARTIAIQQQKIWEITRRILIIFIAIILAVFIAQRSGIQPTLLWATLQTGAQSFYVWLLGPNEVFKPYIIGAILASLLVWIGLWIAARTR